MVPKRAPGGEPRGGGVLLLVVGVLVATKFIVLLAVLIVVRLRILVALAIEFIMIDVIYILYIGDQLQ